MSEIVIKPMSLQFAPHPPFNEGTLNFQHGIYNGDDFNARFTICGDTEAPGGTVFFFPAQPGSEMQGVGIDGIARQLGLQFITLDLYKRGLQPGEVPGMVQKLADKLKVDEFSAVSLSAGSVSSLACARHFPDINPGRLTGVAAVSPIGPLQDPTLEESMPGLVGFITDSYKANRPLYRVLLVRGIWAAFSGWRSVDAERLYNFELSGSNPLDLEYMLQHPVMETITKWDREIALRNLGKYANAKAAFSTRPWGYLPEEINTDEVPVSLYYGEEDNVVPAEMFNRLSGRIEGSKKKVYPGEGHLCILRHAEDIIKDLFPNG